MFVKEVELSGSNELLVDVMQSIEQSAHVAHRNDRRDVDCGPLVLWCERVVRLEQVAFANSSHGWGCACLKSSPIELDSVKLELILRRKYALPLHPLRQRHRNRHGASVSQEAGDERKECERVRDLCIRRQRVSTSASLSRSGLTSRRTIGGVREGSLGDSLGVSRFGPGPRITQQS